MYKEKEKRPSVALMNVLSGISVLISFLCVASQIPEICASNLGKVEIFATGLMLPDGSIEGAQAEILGDMMLDPATVNDFRPENSPITPENIKKKDIIAENVMLEVPVFEIPHVKNEQTHKIVECQFGLAGVKYENFYVNNKTNIDLNITEELKKKPDIGGKEIGKPQVLVVHTHTSESFMDKDQGFYYESFYPRTTNNNYNVTQVGKAIAKSLEKNGIKAIHDITCHDTPSYSGSYKRSADTIDKQLKMNPSIKVVLDIHRDSIANTGGKIKPTFLYNGKKAAQIMIMSGYDKDGSLGFPDWEHNLRLALRLQQKTEQLYPGMTRAMFFGPVRYNMYKTHGSLLIEVGSEANTLEEAIYSGALLGNSLASVMIGA